MDNELKDDLIKSDIEVRYDEHVKKLLSNKKTLAWILKYSAVEYKDCTINEIVGFIEGTPEISSVGVDRGFAVGVGREQIDAHLPHADDEVVGQGIAAVERLAVVGDVGR